MPFRDNLVFRAAHDLFRGHAVKSVEGLPSYILESLEQEAALWSQTQGVFLRWLSPVRLLRPKETRQDLKGEARYCHTRHEVSGELLFNRLHDALADLLRRRGQTPPPRGPAPVMNDQGHDLFWVDSRYCDAMEGYQLWLERQRYFSDPVCCLGAARSLIEARLRHQREVLRQRAVGDTLSECFMALDRLIGKTWQAASRDDLNGLEGQATRLYYEAMKLWIPEVFGFDGRNRQPPRDPFNALLSLGYTVPPKPGMNTCATRTWRRLPGSAARYRNSRLGGCDEDLSRVLRYHR